MWPCERILNEKRKKKKPMEETEIEIQVLYIREISGKETGEYTFRYMDTIKMERWTKGETRQTGGRRRASRREWRLEKQNSFQILLKDKGKKRLYILIKSEARVREIYREGRKRQKKALRRRGSYKIVASSFIGIGAGNYVYVPPWNLFRPVSRV